MNMMTLLVKEFFNLSIFLFSLLLKSFCKNKIICTAFNKQERLEDLHNFCSGGFLPELGKLFFPFSHLANLKGMYLKVLAGVRGKHTKK